MPRRFTETELYDMAAKRGLAEGPRPTPRKPRSQEESLMQRAVIKWWRMACRDFGVPEILLFSIPNGGGRSGPVVGSILKAEGLRKGAPDLMLAVPRVSCASKPMPEKWSGGPTELAELVASGIEVRDAFSGLFLELKTPTGRLQPEQEVFHELLQKQGYRVVVCRSFEECVATITNYLTV